MADFRLSAVDSRLSSAAPSMANSRLPAVDSRLSAPAPSPPFFTCQPVNLSRVSSFCRNETLPARTCVDAAGYRYDKDAHHFHKQAKQCDSKHKAKKACPHTPSLCRALTFDEYCGKYDQECNTDADCVPDCYADCYPCNDRSDCDTLEAFGVLAPPGDDHCYSLYNHTGEVAASSVAWSEDDASEDELDSLGDDSLDIHGWRHVLLVAANASRKAAVRDDALRTTEFAATGAAAREWVFGNHSDGSAFEVCAVGSRGCLHGPVEPINVAEENAAAEAHLATIPAAARHILIIPGRTPNGTPTPYRMNADEHTRVKNAAAYLNTSGAALILTSGGNVHPSGTPFNEAFQMKLTLTREFGVPSHMVVVDPYARHSTTNLRNAGRFMLAYNVSAATIVTDAAQTFLFSHPDVSLFNHQCKQTLGYLVGALSPTASLERTRFVPAPEVWTRDEHEPRDP